MFVVKEGAGTGRDVIDADIDEFVLGDVDCGSSGYTESNISIVLSRVHRKGLNKVSAPKSGTARVP